MIATRAMLGAAALITVGACTTVSDAEPVSREPDGACNADSVQDRVGSTATASLGAQLLTATGARTLRWVPPRSAVTMDFRPDRLTVSYDDAMVVTRISCG